MFNLICSLILPILVLFIIGYSFFKKNNVYDDFIEGAKQSFDIIISMFPCMLAMIFGINIILESGFIDYFFKTFSFIFSKLSVPIEIFPMAIMRPISGSSALAILNNLFDSYGPDSLIGRIASVIQGSTDTTLYVLTLYFGSVGIKKIRYAMYVGLIADLIGIISAIVIVNLLF